MIRKPNIVIFNPDQWRGDALGHMGNDGASTPNLDRMAATDALSFSRAFCQNPVCTPSRCSFMTGMYPHTRGHRTMRYMLHEEHGESNLLSELKKAGYFTWWGGKNDILPGNQDLNKLVDVKFQASEEDLHRWGLKQEFNLHRNQDWRGAPEDAGFYSFYAGCLNGNNGHGYGDSDWQNIHGALDFLRGYDREQPFCLFLALEYPHPPYGVEEPFYSTISRTALPTRIAEPKNWSNMPAAMKALRENQRLSSWDENQWTELRSVYYGMCARVDHQFGLLVDQLKQRGLYEDTLIFFFSDHGDFTGDYGLVEKAQNLFPDCLTRVPFLVKPPKSQTYRHGLSDALIELVDFSATVFDFIGVTPDYDHFGRSLLPILKGVTEEHRQAVFCEGGRRMGEFQANESEALNGEHPETNLYYPRLVLQADDSQPYHGKAAMCRTKNYKYIRRFYEKDEFYDLTADPAELTNLVDQPEYLPHIREHQSMLLDWYVETCDIVPRTLDPR